MLIKNYIDVDLVNYKLPALYIIMPFCTFKCGITNCQNSLLSQEPNIEVSNEELVQIFDQSILSEAIVFGGLEPLDSYQDLLNFITYFHAIGHIEPIVIYTGYTEDEVEQNFSEILLQKNIVIKYGRYIPNQTPHFDVILGVNLASDNQYAIEYNREYKDEQI